MNSKSRPVNRTPLDHSSRSQPRLTDRDHRTRIAYDPHRVGLKRHDWRQTRGGRRMSASCRGLSGLNRLDTFRRDVGNHRTRIAYDPHRVGLKRHDWRQTRGGRRMSASCRGLSRPILAARLERTNLPPPQWWPARNPKTKASVDPPYPAGRGRAAQSPRRDRSRPASPVPSLMAHRIP